MSRLSFLAIALAAVSGGSLAAQSASEQSAQSEIATVTFDTATTRADSSARVVIASASDSVANAPILVSVQPVGLFKPRAFDVPLPQDTTRRKSVTYGDWYARRLRIHRYGSYAMLPLFVTQFVLGNKLIDQKTAQYDGTRTVPIDDGLRSAHKVAAGAVGALFVVNTTTGLWNLFESRHTVEGRKLRTIHALTMLAADAGFAYTGYLSAKAVDRGPPEARKHRNMAVASFSVATVGASLMWFRRD